jgi:hypothetical protein
LVFEENFDLSVDGERFLSVYKVLLDGSGVGREKEVGTVLLAFCLGEVCWKMFCEREGSYVQNLDEFGSELRLCAVQFASEVLKD